MRRRGPARAGRRARPGPGRAMRFRIGIHLGDVMVDGGDLFGEGVNLAARLQSLAEPGGILISEPVYQQVRSKLRSASTTSASGGPRTSPRTCRVYGVVLDDRAAPLQPDLSGDRQVAPAAARGPERPRRAGAGARERPGLARRARAVRRDPRSGWRRSNLSTGGDLVGAVAGARHGDGLRAGGGAAARPRLDHRPADARLRDRPRPRRDQRAHLVGLSLGALADRRDRRADPAARRVAAGRG